MKKQEISKMDCPGGIAYCGDVYRAVLSAKTLNAKIYVRYCGRCTYGRILLVLCQEKVQIKCNQFSLF